MRNSEFEFLRTGQPSATFFKLLSVMLIHDSKLIAVNFAQCLLIAYIA